jgi:hypothetical protein
MSASEWSLATGYAMIAIKDPTPMRFAVFRPDLSTATAASRVVSEDWKSPVDADQSRGTLRIGDISVMSCELLRDGIFPDGVQIFLQRSA